MAIGRAVVHTDPVLLDGPTLVWQLVGPHTPHRSLMSCQHQVRIEPHQLAAVASCRVPHPQHCPSTLGQETCTAGRAMWESRGPINHCSFTGNHTKDKHVALVSDSQA